MNRPHHYYAIPAASPVGMLLSDFMDRCHAASETARQWAEKHGASSYLESPDGMAGGIAALEIPNCVGREGFERVVMPNGNVIFIPEADSPLEQEMYALPVVSETELISILQFKARVRKDGKPLPITFGDQTPPLFLYQGCWYTDVPYECMADGLQSITSSQFASYQFFAGKEAPTA